MREKRAFSVGQVATIVAVVLAAALAMPVGVDAAGDTYVKIRDYKDKSSGGKASVVGNRLLVGDGSGPVTVDGSVQVAGTVGVAGPVTVNGTVTANPPGTTPLVLECSVGAVGDGGSSCALAVPGGRRFVVETVSVAADVASSGSRPGAFLIVTTGGVDHESSVPLVYQRTYGVLDAIVSAQPSMTFYPDPGSTMYGGMSRAGNTQADFRFVVTGHLE